MFIIRLKKIALKNNLSYNIVIIKPHKSAKSNNFLEKIGYYKPLIDRWSNKYTFIDRNRLTFWLNRGVCLDKSVFILIKSLLLYSYSSTLNLKQEEILKESKFLLK